MKNEEPCSQTGIRRCIRRGIAVLILTLVGLTLSREAWWPSLMHYQARSALSYSDPEAALVWLNRVTLLASENHETLFLRSRCFRYQGDFKRVTATLSALHDIHADRHCLETEQILALAQSGKMSAAERHLSRLLTEQTTDLDDVSRAYVLGYMRTHQLDKALTLLDAWTLDSPQNAEAFRIRGNVHLLQNRFSQAEEDFRRSVELAPGRTDVLQSLAAVLVRRQQFDEAARCYRRILKVAPASAIALVGLARSLKGSGDSEDARRVLNEALQLVPGDHDALFELGQMELSVDRLEAAVSLLQRAVDIRPWNDEAHYQLALALQRSGKSDEARSHFEYTGNALKSHDRLAVLDDQLRRDPGNLDALVESGRLLLEFGNPQDGVIRLYAAIDVAPNCLPAHELLAEHYREQAAADPQLESLAEKHEQRVKELRSHSPAGAVPTGSDSAT